MSKSRIAIFASGNGSNAEEIIRHFKDHPTGEVVLVLSNRPDAFALTRAKRNNIESRVFDRATYRDTTEVLQWLREKGVTHIVLAGFLWLVPGYLVDAFRDRIINIHPALLPRYGGRGMYGMKVHEAVRDSGDAETGITIHLVNAHYDEGTILFQAKCDVAPDDTPDAIAQKVHALEYAHFPLVIERWITGEAVTSPAC